MKKKECEHFWMPSKYSQGLGEIWVEDYYCAKCLVTLSKLENEESEE